MTNYEMITESPAIKKATARVLKLSKDERARMIHEDELKAWRDEQAKLSDAITVERIAIARNMLKMKMTSAKIAEATGLSLDEIRKLTR